METTQQAWRRFDGWPHRRAAVIGCGTALIALTPGTCVLGTSGGHGLDCGLGFLATDGGHEAWCEGRRWNLAGDGERNGPAVRWYQDLAHLEWSGGIAYGARTGRWSYWDSQGAIASEGVYVDGVREGPWTLRLEVPLTMAATEAAGWPDSGWRDGDRARDEPPVHVLVQATGSFEHGTREGPWRELTLAGERFELEGGYRMGRRDGRWATWRLANDGRTIAAEGNYVHGAKEGTWREWYAGGALAIVAPYQNGRLDSGPLEVWQANGSRRLAGFLQSGLRVGTWRTWHLGTSDALQLQEDLETGLRIVWRPDGGIAERGFLAEDGAKIGEWVETAPIQDYIDRISTCRTAPGSDGIEPDGPLVVARGAYVGGLREGAWIATWAAGTEAFSGTFHEGVPEGAWALHSVRGASASEGRFAAGARAGRWRDYYQSGQLCEVADFDGESKDGLWMRYYPDGTLAERGDYAAGLKQGRWAYYREDGRPRSVGSYKDDREQGSCTTYNEDGSVASEGRYRDGERQGRWTEHDEHGALTSIDYYQSGEQVRSLCYDDFHHDWREDCFTWRGLQADLDRQRQSWEWMERQRQVEAAARFMAEQDRRDPWVSTRMGWMRQSQARSLTPRYRR